MTRRLFNQQYNTRRLKHLLVLFALMLMPMGAWAQDKDYSKTIYVDSKGETIWITSNNAEDILGDGTMIYDATNNVLTLNNAELSCTTTDAIFISCRDFDNQVLNTLTINLEGSSTITLGNNAGFFYGSALTFTTDVNYPGSLTINKESGWSGKLFENSASGDPTITPTFNNHLYIDHDVESECLIQRLVCPGPFSYNDGNNIVFRFGNETGNDDEVIHYSIDYVDENLQDVTDAVYDVSGNDQPLLGPCTMTYYITAGGGQSETKTAKLFGLATNSVTTTLGTPVAPPTILPAFDHSEDLIITEAQDPATGVAPEYDGTTGLISTSAVGETTCSVKLSNSVANGYDYLVLNDNDDNQKHIFGNFTLTVNEVVNYNLTIGDTQVTSANASDIFGNSPQGEVNGEGTASFAITTDPTTDEEIYTLTLENATIHDYQEWSVFFNYPKLTVHLIGENHIVNGFTYYGQTPETGTVEFTSDGGEENCLIFDSAESIDDLSNPSYYVGFSHCTYNEISEETGWTFGSDANGKLKLYKQAPTEYDLIVAGVTVTSANASNVLDFVNDDQEPAVVFDASTNTLTLTDAEINGEITYSGTSNLTIAFSGTNAVSTSETSAIQYEGSESDRPKLTFSSTNGTLTINGESIIEGFSDVDFGSLNLASISAQGVYYDKEYVFMSGYGSTPSDLTITTEAYYPIWIYNPSLSNTGYSHTQLRGESTIEIGDGTVSFDGDHTITISNINFNYEGNALVVVGPSMPALTVDLVGQSTATRGCTVLSLWDTTPLTFTTSETTPGSFTGYDIVSWIYSGNGQIAYENGLRAFYDADEPYQETISTTGTYIKIGNTPVSATGDINTAEGTAYFDATSNTLTLTDATIGEQGAETGTDIQVLVDDLTIEISGTNTIYGNITYNGSNYRSSNIQINKASSAESASLTATNVSGFSSCTWGDGLYLSAHDGQGATVDVHYEHFEGEGGLMESYYGGEIADVTFSTTGTNAIWVAGTQVTSDNAGNLFAGDETNDGKVSYDFDTHTLTLDDASLYTNEAQPSPMIISQGALNVLLKGDSYISFNGDYSTYVFKNTGSSGALTISAYDSEASLGVTSDYYEGDYKGLCDGFSQVSFNDDLGLFNRSGSKAIENITRHAPSFYVSDRTVYWSTNDGLLLNATYHYKIDYVDDTIEGSGEEVNLATDETNWGFGGASLDISEFAEPCTITAYTKVNGTITGSNKAKFFTSNPSPFRLVYGADPVDLVLAPAIEESDGISITGIEANVTYNTETGKISSETMGSFGGPVAMREDGQTTILNNYFTMNFEVVPPAPTVNLEAGAYLATHDPITLTGTSQAGTQLMYQWDDGNAEEYAEAIPFQAGTLMAWETYSDGNTVVVGDTTTVVYTLATDLEITYASGQSWATYYATENLTVPEGLTAYVVSSVDATSGTVTTEPVDYIPVNEAVLLKHNEGAPLTGFAATPYTGTETPVTNQLLGTAEGVDVSSINNGTVYVLHNDGFTRATKGTIPAHRGYLLVPAAAAPAGSRLAIIVRDVTTGISEAVIVDNAGTDCYNISGQRVAAPNRGLYIINGKKTIVK